MIDKEFCRLVYFDEKGNEVLIEVGRWALMQKKKKELERDAFYQKKRLKLRYYFCQKT